MARGPKSKYTEALADEFCSDLAQGIPLAETCRRVNIGRTTVYLWQENHPDFAERIARAREIGFDAIAEECLEIAEDGSNDWIARNGKDGEESGYTLNGEHVQRSKLRIETRLKLLAKWSPKRYGDLLKLGDPDGQSLTVQVVRFGEKSGA